MCITIACGLHSRSRAGFWKNDGAAVRAVRTIQYNNLLFYLLLIIIMEWIPGEKRKRGRPRKTWMEGVRAAMKSRHLEEDQWLNRKEWCLGSGRRRQLSQDRKDR